MCIRDRYKISCVTLNLSEKPEPFGRTIIEAAACGCKVIGWDRGGVGESIKLINPEGLIDFQDFDSLVNKLREFLANQDDDTYFPEKFTLDYQCQQTLELYRDILKH